jgi:hypothetical protein
VGLVGGAIQQLDERTSTSEPRISAGDVRITHGIASKKTTTTTQKPHLHHLL